MKKTMTSLALAFFAFCTVAKAQLEHGTWLLGADMANARLSLDKGGAFEFNLSPKLAFFVRDNLALGAYIDFGLQTAKDAGTGVNYGIGALGRYYVSNSQVDVLRHTRLFVEGTAGINGYNPATGDNTNGLGLSVGPGLAYFISRNVGVEALVKYSGIVGFGSRVTSNDLLLGIGLQVYLPSGLVRSSIKRD
jgi:hypothetical protein